MNLNQPYYIEPRENSIDLGGEWDFFFSDNIVENITDDMYKHKTTLPKSIYHSLSEAGILPHPYKGANCKLYHWVDEKVWYYRKRFILNNADFCGNAFLCFDGIAYYCRVWVNGKLIGEHEGMFGGPVCDIYEILNLDGENEIVVEVKACNYGQKENFDPWNPHGENSQIVPWNIARDKFTTTGDFIVVGIWNRIRLELVEKYHISRPYVYTKKIEQDEADLFVEIEIADGFINELKPYYGYYDDCNGYTRAFDMGVTGKKRDDEIEICIDVKDGDVSAYSSVDKVKLTDFEKSLLNPKYYELQFFSKDIKIKNPKLWYPTGLGEPFLYDVEITMKREGVVCDRHVIKTGIRTFEATRTGGEKMRTRWENFKFLINGRNFFLMGINWAPIDFLYSIDPAEYEWCLTLAKNAGVQMLRVWNGGGMIETDTFYELCDKLGIMVWQDHLIANTADTHSFPQDILESQEAYNIYRIRNHPSLVMHCGGNEFNPYNVGNAASMFVITRILRDLDPQRIFHYTTADRGSAHIYRDMEPVWYRHIYKQLPFLAESGINCFPSFKALWNLIDYEECKGILPDLMSAEFVKNYPELLNHFSEYKPYLIPKMMSRCSQIGNVKEFSLRDICEATQVQAFEFYQIMIEAMRENYPVCGGILPWLFKRPWATVGVQMVDGWGQPLHQYYAMQNAYKPLHICLCIEWTLIAPGEKVPLKVKIFNQDNIDLLNTKATITVYGPDMTVVFEKTNEGCPEIDFGDFIPDDMYTDKCFLISVSLENEDKLLSRTTYFIKCTSILSDNEKYNQNRSKATENIYFDNGPWLKENISSAEQAMLDVKLLGKGKIGAYNYADIEIKNISQIAAYPVIIDADNKDVRTVTTDNFFLLKQGEVTTVRITFDKEAEYKITVGAWNCQHKCLKI